MRKTLYRTLYSVVLFCIVVLLLEIFASGSGTQTTTTMSEAVLPVVTMETGGTAFNTLYGNTDPLNPGAMRTLLTPISSERQMKLTIRLYGQTLTGVSVEVRDITGERLIEEPSPEYRIAEDTASVSLSFQNLIQPDTEYLLVLTLSTEETDSVWYYTRFTYSEDDSCLELAEEALEFVQSFHDMTFDPSNAEELLTYLEPSDKVSNSSFSCVGLENSADQVTWGDLEPRQVTEPIYSVTDMEDGYIGIRGSYYVSTEPKDGESAERTLLYRCEEYYELRKGTDRFYLMDYERTMSQDFDPSHPYGTGGNLCIGIAQTDMQVVQTAKEDVTAFVHDGRLYEVMSSDDLLIYIYGFDAAGDTGVRETHAEHDIRILHMETDGSIDFLVYGYMNCGQHEGRTGISFYHYSGEYHTLEEKVFVPYSGSFEILDQKIGQIAHYDVERDKLYLTMEDTLYEIDVDSCSLRAVVEDLSSKRAVISDSGALIAYEEWADGEATGRILLRNLNGTEEKVVEPPEKEMAVPLGFLGQDLIYGTLKTEDIITDSTGNVLEPMGHIYIVNQQLEVLEDYHQEGYYVSSCEIRDNQILLERVQRAAAGSTGGVEYLAAEEDTISSGQTQSQTQLVQTVSDARYGSTVQIGVGISDWSDGKYLRPQEILYEGSRELVPGESSKGEESRDDGYYVYSGKGLKERTQSISDAIAAAKEFNTGVVLNGEGRYVWKKARASRSEIDALTTIEEGTASRGSREACLEAMLSLEGVTADVSAMIEQGMTDVSILEQAFETDAAVLNLTGCTLEEVLYYVGQGSPVYACRADGSTVLLVGYGPENIEIYDPDAGEVYLQKISEAAEDFEKAGNRFLSYITANGAA